MDKLNKSCSVRWNIKNIHLLKTLTSFRVVKHLMTSNLEWPNNFNYFMFLAKSNLKMVC